MALPNKYRQREEKLMFMGHAPQLPDGNIATLHHIGQNSKGSLVEASSDIHKKYYKTLH